MAPSSNWYRSKDWDEQARADFDARIRRARDASRRAFYFGVKASAMFYGRPEDPALRRAAIELLERALRESGAQGGDRTELLDHLGRCQLLLGEREAGIRTLEAAAAGERSIAVHDPPMEIVLGRRKLEHGDRDTARRLFDAAYARTSCPRAYDELASQEILDADGLVVSDPEAAAESIVVYYHAAEEHPGVPEVFAGDLHALAALDRLFAIERDLRRPHAPRTRYRPAFLEQQFLPGLGAFVGRALVKEGGARWRIATPVMKSRVLLGNGEIDPFRIAYDAIYYEVPMAERVKEALSP